MSSISTTNEPKTEDNFWEKCRDILLIPRLHIKSPHLSREVLHLLEGFISFQQCSPAYSDILKFHETDKTLPVKILVDKVLSMVLVEEIMRNWRQCCIFQLKTIIQKHKFPKCSKRVSKLFPFSSPGTLCNICLHENGESTLQPKETTLFDIVQSRDLLQTSTINHPLDAIIHLLIPSKSYLNDIALYVKQQLLSLFHHKGNIVLKAAERDCLDNLSLHLYGSCVTGLQLSTVESDIDLMIEPPSSVRVLKMVNHDSPLDVPSESDSDSDEELQNNQANNSSDDQRSNRIRSVVCQEFKKLLEQLVRAEKKFLSRPNIPALARQKSTLYIEFFAAGILKSCEDERNFPQTVGSSTSKSSKPSRQQTVHLSDGLPEIDLLKLVEKLVRKYGANYGITLTQWLHHIRVPLLSVQIQLPPDLNYPESPRVISSDLTLFKSLPLKNTAFICTYLQWDQTNKVKSLILLIKRFVQVNDIHGASKGYLSSYTWVMLVFHYLLRLRLIPALDDETNGVNPNNSNDSNKFQFSLQLCSSTILESISVFELLKFFFWYYTTQIDVYTNVVTLRGNGEILDKAIWKTKCKSWRLSIEDPFERADSSFPHDLGGPLRLVGQTKIFSVLTTGYEKMKEIEELCRLGEVDKAGALFYSLFEGMLIDSSHNKSSKSGGKTKKMKVNKEGGTSTSQTVQGVNQSVGDPSHGQQNKNRRNKQPQGGPKVTTDKAVNSEGGTAQGVNQSVGNPSHGQQNKNRRNKQPQGGPKVTTDKAVNSEGGTAQGVNQSVGDPSHGQQNKNRRNKQSRGGRNLQPNPLNGGHHSSEGR